MYIFHHWLLLISTRLKWALVSMWRSTECLNPWHEVPYIIILNVKEPLPSIGKVAKGTCSWNRVIHHISPKGNQPQNILEKDWCWSSNTLATWCKELTHWKRPWCWERLRAGGEVDDRGWDGWMVSRTQWTSIWVGSGSWWWTGKPGVLQSLGLQRVGHNWGTELNWT